MASDLKTYYTLRKFPDNGRVLEPGEPVHLHPKQAKYLLGTHLTEARPDSKSAAKAQSKGDK